MGRTPKGERETQRDADTKAAENRLSRGTSAKIRESNDALEFLDIDRGLC